MRGRHNYFKSLFRNENPELVRISLLRSSLHCNLETRMNFTQRAIAAAALLVATAASAAPITYNMNLSIGAGSAVGTITTDGTIGSVGTGNIVSYSILLSPVPGSQFLLTDVNSDIGNTANLISTATDLSFDFDVTSYWLMQNPFVGSGQNFLCFAGVGQVCGGFGGPGLSMSTDVFASSFSSVTGTSIVATAANNVPEPGTWGLAALALLGASVSRRRRQPA